MRWTINKKLIISFAGISLLIGLAGGFGALNVLKIRKATFIISSEEMPVSEAVSEMYSLLLINKDLIEVYKSATTAIPVYNEKILPELEKELQNNIKTFNLYANAVMNGSIIDDHAILPTKNPELRNIVNEVMARCMSDFQTSANEIIKMGKEMLTQKDKVIYFKMEMGGVYEYMETLFAELDVQIAKKGQSTNYLKDIKDMRTILAKSRIILEEIAQYGTIDMIPDKENSLKTYCFEFDSWLAIIHEDLIPNQREGQEGVIKGDGITDIIEKLSQYFLEFKQWSNYLIAAQKELINIKNKSDLAIKRLDEAKKGMSLILMKAKGETEKGVKHAQAIADATEARAQFNLYLIASIGTILGILLGVLFSRQIIGELKLLAKATQAISSGNLEHKVVVSSKDEIRILADAFNKMTEDLKQTTVSKQDLEEMLKERTKQLETTYKQLIHSEKLSATGKMSASIAHEFNNPICGIRNVLERVNERVSNGNLDETHKTILGMAIKECNRIAELIKKLQDFHRPSFGIIAPMNLHDAINDIVGMHKNILNERKIILETHYANGIPMIEAVSDQIKQVILNLIQNAEEAIPEEGGKITIITESIGSVVKIYIQDTGCGIPQENMESIFEPFFTTKGAVKGTGLGLSISYGIIKKHGGNIDVQSQPDKGTTFAITLPIKGKENG